MTDSSTDPRAGRSPDPAILSEALDLAAPLAGTSPATASPSAADPMVGRVIGTTDATPFSFWVGIGEGQYLQLDDVVALRQAIPGVGDVAIYGIVTQLRARQIGTQFDNDVFLAASGRIPAEVTQAACVQATRFEPEYFVPPLPGTPVWRATGADRSAALFFDQMKETVVAGQSRDSLPVYLNLEFLDGRRGAHVNISGVSGVATKTTYACFLLYSLFSSPATMKILGNQTSALVFNVKGEDLLWLDRENTKLTEDQRKTYANLGLPVGAFHGVRFFAPPRAGGGGVEPAVESRTDGAIRPFFWTPKDFCRDELLQFLFADADDDRQQYTIVVGNVMAKLKKEAEALPNGRIRIGGTTVVTLSQLFDVIEANLDTESPDNWAGRAIGQGTVNAFIRRLRAAERELGPLVRADIDDAETYQLQPGGRVTVVDLHTLGDRAKRFVVGVVLRQAFQDKERRGRKGGVQFVVLDELNKYAPREGSSPIKELLLDIAERGRSLGVVLIGAQQTASEVERRIVANCAIRVVGRLDSAEALRAEYGFLVGTQQQRATILKPGTMLVSQPEVPMPVLVQFPFPSWATRQSEAAGPVAGTSNVRQPDPTQSMFDQIK